MRQTLLTSLFLPLGLFIYLSEPLLCFAETELQDDPQTIEVLKEAGAITDEMLEYVKRRKDGYIPSLDLAGTDVKAILPHLDGLEKLVGLEIDVTECSAEEVETLSDLTTLEYLRIECRDEHVYALQELSNLVRLEFRGRHIHDDSLRYLSGMTKLERLELRGHPITGEGFKHLRGFDKLQGLFVEESQLNDQGIENIVASFPKLSHLEYYGTPVTIEGAYNTHFNLN